MSHSLEGTVLIMDQCASHIAIGDRRIGAGEPAYIIAEVGLNHNGDPGIARRLIDVAVNAQADAVKFQKRQLSSLYAGETLLDPTQEEKEIGFLLPFLQEFELSDEALSDLSDYCGEREIEFLCTPWEGGIRPVNMVAWPGSVSGAGVVTLANRTPSPARRSMFGVIGPGWP